VSGLLTIDGSQGEGGGQILRTSLSLAAIAGRAIRIENIRAGRPKPGLAAQHLTAVRAVAALCRARLAGDEIGSGRLDFLPEAPVQAGDYAFDVAAARRGGSAGATGLVLQAVLPPLALAGGRSRVSIRGGTHVAWSPSFDYLRDVWLPALAAMGIAARLELRRSGWYPIGEGQIEAVVEGRALAERPLRPLTLLERGRLLEVTGRAVTANLPAQIPRRMAERARALLAEQGVQAGIEVEVLQAACAGAGIFLTAHYENLRCGFNALGERGKPAEAVAEEAAEALLAHMASGAALDLHLADQVVLPLSLAAGPSRFTVERITPHLETNARVVELFGAARVGLEDAEGGTGLVTVAPAGSRAGRTRSPVPFSRA
jgi:RNA 3'-terminal phosphate cyclase (ATP)